MKKYTAIYSLLVVCIALLFTSCGRQKADDSFIGKYAADDTKTLEDLLTKEYDLADLESFFAESNASERLGFGSTAAALTFREVNDRYPVEVLRTGGYTVYKVRQGGYFYVFWVQPLDTDQSGEPSVYFSAYLPSGLSPDLFDSLTLGSSTAEDVRKIDPAFELSFLQSNGTYSYSYINDDTVLQVRYEYSEDLDGYDDLIVKEVSLLDRTSAPTRYSALLAGDLP